MIIIFTIILVKIKTLNTRETTRMVVDSNSYFSRFKKEQQKLN